MSCEFCLVIAGELPAFVVDEGATWIAFLSRGPSVPGHTLIVPREHRSAIWDCDEVEAAELGEAQRRVAVRLREKLSCEGVNLASANGEAAWQSIAHLHFHVVPRYLGDSATPRFDGDEAPDAELLELSLRLR